MRLLIATLVTGLLAITYAQEPKNIEKKIANFYGKSGIKISYYTEKIIGDPITPGAPNNKVKVLFDDKKKLLGFARDIVTTTGCDNLCHPLQFTMFFNAQGNFTTFISREPMTKKNHIPMSDEETQTLMLFLLSNKKTAIPEPHTIVDAITSATKTEFSSGVVKDAALTCYRMLHYKQQTEAELLTLIKSKNF